MMKANTTFKFSHGRSIKFSFPNYDNNFCLYILFNCRHVDDIDAFIGMVVEEPINGALVGQTVGCILGKHFHDLKFGDRFWYENPAGVQALKPSKYSKFRQGLVQDFVK